MEISTDTGPRVGPPPVTGDVKPGELITKGNQWGSEVSLTWR